MTKYFYILLFLFFSISCKFESKPDTDSTKTSFISNNFEFTSELKHAVGFKITKHKGYKSIVIKDSWNPGKNYSSYILYPKNNKPDSLPEADFYVPVPVENVVNLSSTQVGYMKHLKAENKIIGILDAGKIYDSVLFQKYKSGEIANVGSGMSENTEMLIGVQPDIIFKSGFSGIQVKDEIYNQAGIPIGYSLAWREETLLGRAEWIKFYAAFLNLEKRADSVYNVIIERFTKFENLAKNVDNRPKAMSGIDYKGTWYVPGGKSYMAALFKQAGADYYWKDNTSTGSIPLSFESVLEHQSNADIWLLTDMTNITDLTARDERYKLFNAYKDGEIYSFVKRLSKGGGNDYWESGAANPDILIKDFIKIFQPQLLPEYELYFWKKLN